MDANTKSTDKKKYDLSAIDELFKDCITPEELREELIEIAFDYVHCVDDGNIDLFKSNMSTLYVLCSTLKDVSVLQAN